MIAVAVGVRSAVVPIVAIVGEHLSHRIHYPLFRLLDLVLGSYKLHYKNEGQ